MLLIVIRTQVQIPDVLYAQAREISERQEISLSEVVRRGLEYMVCVSGRSKDVSATNWSLPDPVHLGGDDPFLDPEWRVKLHAPCGRIAEQRAAYGKKKRRGE